MYRFNELIFSGGEVYATPTAPQTLPVAESRPAAPALPRISDLRGLFARALATVHAPVHVRGRMG